MMKTFFTILLLSLIVLSRAKSEDKPKEDTNSTVSPISVAPEPAHNATTSAPPKPTKPPTTSTEPPTKPSTTVTTTTTTTVKPPPTTKTTTTTTQAPSPPTTPNTTSTAVPPTSPPTTPAPSPKPTQGTWFVNDTSGNSSCILLKMTGTIVVNYTDTSSHIQEGELIIPTTANATGNCGETLQNIMLSWNVETNFTDSIEFTFKKNGTKFELDSINITVVLDGKNFPNAKAANTTFNVSRVKEDFETPLKNSYKCSKLQILPIVNSTKNEVGSFRVQDLQLQAFGTIVNEKFSDAKDCEPYETPDVVPIAVGCALMGLIIIVLIGYLIGRRRNQARGYLSM